MDDGFHTQHPTAVLRILSAYMTRSRLRQTASVSINQNKYNTVKDNILFQTSQISPSLVQVDFK